MQAKESNAILTVIAGVCLLGVGLILHIVGVATPAWMSRGGDPSQQLEKIKAGLFIICGNDDCDHHSEVSDYLRAVQVLTIKGAVLAGLALLMSVIFTVLIYQRQTKRKLLLIGTGVLGLLAGLLISIGFIIYVVKVFPDDNYGEHPYGLDISFILCVVGSGLIDFSAILIWKEGCRVTSATAQHTNILIPGNYPLAVVNQNSNGGAANFPQPLQSSAMQQSPGFMYPPAMSLPPPYAADPPPLWRPDPPPQSRKIPPPRVYGSETKPPKEALAAGGNNN